MQLFSKLNIRQTISYVVVIKSARMAYLHGSFLLLFTASGLTLLPQSYIFEVLSFILLTSLSRAVYLSVL